MVFDSDRSGKLNLTMLVKTDSIRAYEYYLYLGTLIFVRNFGDKPVSETTTL